MIHLSKIQLHGQKSISFRPVNLADLNAIVLFPCNKRELFYFSPSAPYPLTLAHLKAQISARHESTVMLDKQIIVGFANFYNIKKYQVAFIGNLIIKPEYRHQGLAKQLLAMMIEKGFKQLQLKEVHLSCFQQNTPALALYQQLGFVAYAEDIRYNNDGQAMKLIHLKIKNPLLSQNQ